MKIIFFFCLYPPISGEGRVGCLQGEAFQPQSGDLFVEHNHTQFSLFPPISGEAGMG